MCKEIVYNANIHYYIILKLFTFRECFRANKDKSKSVKVKEEKEVEAVGGGTSIA